MTRSTLDVIIEMHAHHLAGAAWLISCGYYDAAIERIEDSRRLGNGIQPAEVNTRALELRIALYSALVERALDDTAERLDRWIENRTLST